MRRLLFSKNFIRAFTSDAGQGAKPPAAAAAPLKPKVEPPPPPAPKVDPFKNVFGKVEWKSYDGRKIHKFDFLGLSKKCVATNEQRQVPGTGKDYLNIEYYGYNRLSFAEAEVEMENFRIAQPKAPRK